MYSNQLNLSTPLNQTLRTSITKAENLSQKPPFQHLNLLKLPLDVEISCLSYRFRNQLHFEILQRHPTGHNSLKYFFLKSSLHLEVAHPRPYQALSLIVFVPAGSACCAGLGRSSMPVSHHQQQQPIRGERAVVSQPGAVVEEGHRHVPSAPASGHGRHTESGPSVPKAAAMVPGNCRQVLGA